MKDRILIDYGEYQIRSRPNKNKCHRIYIWHPKTATVKGKGRTIPDVMELLDALLGLNYYAASHPWGKEGHRNRAA